MKNFQWLKQIASSQSKLERRLSLGEYKRAVSWSKYLVSSGAAIKGGGEDEWSADMSQLYIGNKFASGRHSRIYRGVYKQRDVAIKLISQPEEDGDLAALLESHFTSEVAILFRLRHPNIISFIAACKKAPVFCIITEYYPGGSLRKYLHQQEPYSLPLNLVLRLSLDIAHGMQYLHTQGILHRDLKSENLLLDEDMCVKVADFGISCLESQCGSAKGFTGTYRWMAPEMIKEKHHTKKVDVYSYGIVLWELFTALIPFDDMTPEQAAFAVCQKMSLCVKKCIPSTPTKKATNVRLYHRLSTIRLCCPIYLGLLFSRMRGLHCRLHAPWHFVISFTVAGQAIPTSGPTLMRSWESSRAIRSLSIKIQSSLLRTIHRRVALSQDAFRSALLFVDLRL